MRNSLYYKVLIILVLVLVCRGISRPHAGMWVVRYALASNIDVQKVISVSEKLRINALYVQVYALGQNYWNSEYFSDAHAADVASGLLNRLIHKAHDQGIRVHAWLNVFFIWNKDELPGQMNHPYLLYPESILRIDSTTVLPVYSDLKKAGIEGYYIDPANPAYRQRFGLMIKELLEQYEFDGIHLDYFRYPAGRFVHSPVGRTMFMMQQFFDPLKQYKKLATYVNGDRILYNQFLENNLTSFLSETKTGLQRKNIELSIAVKPNRYQARYMFHQDWSFWLEQGLCDRVMIMNYSPQFDIFSDNIHLLESTPNIQDKVVNGLAVYNQPPEQVADKLAYIQKKPMGGIAYFSYNYFKEHPGYLQRLLQLIR